MKLKIRKGSLLGVKISRKENSIVISSDVTSIEENAFFHARKRLKKIMLPSSVKKVGKSAFCKCVNLDEVLFSDNIDEIGKYSFSGCSSLKTIKLPPLVKFIGERVFSDCSSLTKVILPDNLEEIGYATFDNCTSLKDIEFNNSIVSIGKNAFEFCRSIEKLEFPSSLIYIGDSAFYGCSNLKEVVLPPSLKVINKETFSSCKSLKTIKMPKKLELIEARAFNGCSDLNEIYFPQNLKYIDDFAFQNCNKLKNIILPSGVRTLGMESFSGCENLQTISLKEGLESIGRGCFSCCKSIEEIKIPFSVTNIDYNAFGGCSSLKVINLKNVYNLFESGLQHYCDSCYYYFDEETNEIKLSSIKLENLQEVNYHQKIFNGEKWKKNEKVAMLIVFGEEKLRKLKYVSNILPFIMHESYGDFEYDSLIEYKEFYKLKKRVFGNTSDSTLIEYDLFKLSASLGAFESDNVVRQKACEFITNAFDKNSFNVNKFHGMFESFLLKKYNKEWADFLMNKNNFLKLMEIENNQNGFISRVFNNFEEIREFGKSNRGNQRYRKVTVDMCREYLAKIDFIGVSEETFDIAEEISKYTHLQSTFNKAVEIRKEYLALREQNKANDHILGEEICSNVFDEIDEQREIILDDIGNVLTNLNNVSNNNFSYEFLSKNDVKNFTLGKYCSCCAHLEGVGIGIVKASIIHPDCQNLVIRNENGEIIAKSTLYVNRNQGYGLFNNVEVNDKYFKRENIVKIYKKYKLAINKFAQRYNELHKDNPIKQINVGINFNDLSEEIIKNDEISKKLFRGIDFSEYGGNHIGDYQEHQYIVWKECK